jgi:hypothetical protein
MDLVEVGWGDVDWVGLAQDRDRWRALVNSVLNLPVVGGKARGKEATKKTIYIMYSISYNEPLKKLIRFM